MFHISELKIKLLKFLQWQSMGVHDFPIVKIGLMGAINHCFNNESQTDPSPCNFEYFHFSSKITLPEERIVRHVHEHRLVGLHRVRDQFVIYCQNNDLLHPKTVISQCKR